MPVLLLIRGIHCLSNEDLRRFVKRVFVVSSVLIAAVGLLLHFDLLDATDALPHVFEQTHFLELHLLAEGRDQLFEESRVLLVEGQVNKLLLYSF